MAGVTSVEQAFFQGIAEALGFRSNKTAMAVLAQRCPVAELLEMDPTEREARLFGAAGFLEKEGFDEAASPEAKQCLGRLWDRWWRIRDQVEPVRSRSIPWWFAGNRPLNHPQRRVGALATLLSNWDEVKRNWEFPVNNLEKDVNNLLKNLQHSFWERNYTLRANPAASSLRLMGKDRTRDVLGNVIFPGVIGLEGDGARQWEAYRSLRKVDTNQHLRRATLRLFGPDEQRRKLFTTYYHQQQGLLQIYRDFCLEDASDCAQCPFPEQLLQWHGVVQRPVAPSERHETMLLQ